VAVSRVIDRVGQVLGGRYRLLAPVGTGASASVYLADDVTLRRRVAVKILHDALAEDEAFLRRFRAEAHAAAALNHPHVVAIYDWGQDPDSHIPYLVTEYLGGGSLRALLDAASPLSLSQTLLVGLETARGLEYAHRRGFVHRDIKPANLLFDEDARLRIADFGLARALAEAAWTEPMGAVLGTARYASPEQARGETLDGRSDVYSLALVLVEAATGNVPFSTDTTIGTLMARIHKPLPVPDELGALQGPLRWAGDPDPTTRPDAAEFGAALMAAANSFDRPAPLPLAGARVSTGEFGARDPTESPGGPASVGAVPDADADPTEIEGPPVVGAVVGVVVASAPGAGAPDTTVVESSTEFSESVPDGEIIAQDPAPGTEIPRGGSISVVVSRGQPFVAVPGDLTGLPFSEASAKLAQVGLAVGGIENRYDEEIPAEHVIALGPDTPVRLQKRNFVGLIVSDGPAPRTVPDVVGSTEEEARAAVEGLGLEVAVADPEFSETVNEGLVISATPRPGATLERGETVRIVVSKGPPLVAVPDVADLSVADAEDRIEAAGLTVSGTRGSTRQKVTSTDPAAGTMVEPGSSVGLVTSGAGAADATDD